jgi:hypothetical protein
VVNFWLGSSKGAQDKDEAQAAQTSQVLQAQVQQTNTALNTAHVATEKATTAATAAAAATTAATNAANTAASTAATAAAASGAGELSLVAAPKTDETTNFNECLAVVFSEEGGYTNDPDDPGGPTNFGITLKDLEDWRGRPVTAEDVKNMTKAEAREIYRSKYWNPMQCGDLPAGIDLEVFDFGVNAGPRTAIRMLQSVLGVIADGSIGPITLSASRAAVPRTVIEDFSERRLEYYRSLREWPHFGAGWTNRTNSVEKVALRMLSPAEMAAA